MTPTDATSSQQTARDSSKEDSSPRGLALFLLMLATALGAALRIHFLARKSFWFDECFSVEAARLDWSNFLHLMWWREANMSLYYLLLRGWLHLGDSPGFIRGLAVVFAVAAVPAMYWLGRALFDRKTSLFAAALLSVNAYSIRYAQEARSYSLFLLLAILSSGFFCRYLKSSRLSDWRGYVLCSALAVYAHFYALLLIGTHAVALWLIARSRARDEAAWNAIRELRRAFLWIGIASVPLIIFIAKTGAGPIRWIHRPAGPELLSFAEHLAGNGGWPLLVIYVVGSVAALVPRGSGIVSATTKASDKQGIWRMQFLLLWLCLPVLLTVILSFARPLFLGRYFIFCLPPFILLAAEGTARLKKPWQSGVALGIMILFSLEGTFAYYQRDFDVERDGIGTATDLVLDNAQPGDAVIFHIAETRVGYEFFESVRGNGNAASLSSEDGVPEIIYPHHADRLDYRDFTGKPAADFLATVPQQYERVWVVLMNNQYANGMDASTRMIEATLGQKFLLTQVAGFPQVEVRLYTKR